MNNINVISINPAQPTKAAMHPEIFERIARDCRTRTSAAASASLRPFKLLLNAISGINAGVSKSMSARLLILRLLAGALLIGLALYPTGVGPLAFTADWCQLILGVAIVCGFMTRIFCLAGAAIFATFAIQAGMAGEVDLYMILPAMIAMVFIIIGPGIYCIDQIIRRGLFRNARRRAKLRIEKLAATRMSYKAFSLRP